MYKFPPCPFRPISHYAYGVWRKVNGSKEVFRELAVAGSIPDILEHVIRVEQLTEGVAGEDSPWWEWFSLGEGQWAAPRHAAPVLGYLPD